MADTVLQPAPRGGRDGRVCQAPPVEPGALLSQPASALSWPSTWRGTASGGEAPRKSLLPESLWNLPTFLNMDIPLCSLKLIF